MSRTEDLLREALASTPVDPTADVMHGLDARIRRARRRLAAVAAVAAAVVVAAVAVPLATVAHGGSRSSRVTITGRPSPAPTTGGKINVASEWLSSGATQVAVGDDGSGSEGVWALVPNTGVEQAQVVGFDPATGTIRHRITVPGPVDYLSVGLGYVWAYGGGDGGYGSLSVIDRIKPQSGKVDTLQIHGKGAPSSMGFTAQGAYVALAVADKVVRISGVEGPLSIGQSVAVPNQPDGLTIANDGTAWVRESLTGRWAHLDLADGHATLIETQRWPHQFFGISHDGFFWSSDGPRRLVEVSPATLSAGVSVSYGDRVETVGQVDSAVEQVGGSGVFVATGDPEGVTSSDNPTGISYYSTQAIRAGAAPTAQLVGPLAGSLAATDDGGVVFATDSGSVYYWKP